MTADVRQMLFGFMTTQALHVVAKLGLADALSASPRTAAELAKTTGAHAPSLLRLLLFLSSLGLLRQDVQGRFDLTEAGAQLRPDHPESVRPWASLLGEPFIWRVVASR